MNERFAFYVMFWWHSRSHTYKKGNNFLLHLSNPLSSAHHFSPCLSPLQSSCQPATSSAVATAASWPGTAPSVSAVTALRSGRMERAAEVGFSCSGAGGAAVNLTGCRSLSPLALGQASLPGLRRKSSLRTVCLQAPPSHNNSFSSQQPIGVKIELFFFFFNEKF